MCVSFKTFFLSYFVFLTFALSTTSHLFSAARWNSPLRLTVLKKSYCIFNSWPSGRRRRWWCLVVGGSEEGAATLSVAKQFTSGIVFNGFLKAMNCMVNSSVWTLSTLKYTQHREFTGSLGSAASWDDVMKTWRVCLLVVLFFWFMPFFILQKCLTVRQFSVCVCVCLRRREQMT